MDTICLKPIKSLIKNQSMVIGIEYPPNHNNGNTQYNQWFIASSPQNSFFIYLMEEIKLRNNKLNLYGINLCLLTDKRSSNHETAKTLWLTGPYPFSDIIDKQLNKSSILICDRCTLGSYDNSEKCRKNA